MGQHGECLRAILDHLGGVHERESASDLVLVERLQAEEVEIDRLPMRKMQRDGGAAIEHEGKPGRRSQLLPYFLLRRRQDIELGIKVSRHEMPCAAARSESRRTSRARDARARNSTSGG